MELESRRGTKWPSVHEPARIRNEGNKVENETMYHVVILIFHSRLRSFYPSFCSFRVFCFPLITEITRYRIYKEGCEINARKITARKTEQIYVTNDPVLESRVLLESPKCSKKSFLINWFHEICSTKYATIRVEIEVRLF